MVVFEGAGKAGCGDVTEAFADLLAGECVVAEHPPGDAHPFFRGVDSRSDSCLGAEDAGQVFARDLEFFRNGGDIQFPFKVCGDQLLSGTDEFGFR